MRRFLDRYMHRPVIATWAGRPSLPLIFGIAVAVTYGVFALLASLRYPHAYSPWNNNTLSQLGNPNLNPHGAVFYLIGCALAGTSTMAFFASLSPWRLSGTPAQNRLLLLFQGLGIVGGFGLLMNAVYAENQLPMHHFWAGVVFNCLGATMLLAPMTLWRQGRPNIQLSAFSFLSFAAVILMFVFARTHWVEWVPVTMFLISPGLLGLHTREIAASLRHQLPHPHLSLQESL